MKVRESARSCGAAPIVSSGLQLILLGCSSRLLPISFLAAVTSLVSFLYIFFLCLDPHISVFCSAFQKVVFLLAKSLTFSSVSFCQAARPPSLQLYSYSSSPFDRVPSSSC